MTAIAGSGWRRRPGLVRAAIYTLGLIPACWYVFLGVTDQLGADPMKTLERMLGLWSLRFLVAVLAITPLVRLGGPRLIGYRRAIGLMAFIYAALHLTVYLVLDQQFDWPAIWGDIVKRPYITIGMAAFLILLALAVTSHDAMVRRMGAAAWRRLHWWVYVAAIGGALHFLLLVKSWPREPIIYAALIAGLLAIRLMWRGGDRRRRRVRRDGPDQGRDQPATSADAP